jgi:hypothetical protein
MSRVSVYATLLSLLLPLSLAGAGAAQVIPAGTDLWATPNDGNTAFVFPEGDVESLCGAPPSTGWNHTVTLSGPPNEGPQGDTAVKRLQNVNLGSGKGSTPVQITNLALVSTATQNTPCGPLNWTASLYGTQPVTTMTLVQTGSYGGTFTANLQVNVQLNATNASSGAPVGTLFYSVSLPDPGTGTAWSINSSTGQFRAGMDAANNCIEVLRQKQGTAAGEGSHAYCIADAISQGNCNLPCLKDN